MESRDVVVISGSAGSLEPLQELAAALPADLPASVLVTVHVGEHARSRLPWLLSRSGPLPAEHARPGERLRPRRVYVAPPGCHLLLTGGVTELSNGPRSTMHGQLMPRADWATRLSESLRAQLHGARGPDL